MPRENVTEEKQKSQLQGFLKLGKVTGEDGRMEETSTAPPVGTMHQAAQAQATQVSPPAQGGPPTPSKPSAKKELDNPNQYGKPPTLGPPKGNMKTPAFEEILKACGEVGIQGVDPYDAAEKLFYGEGESKEEDAEEDAEAETSGGSVEEQVTTATADGQGDGSAAPASRAFPVGQGIGSAPTPSLGGPPKGDLRFTPKATPSPATDKATFATEVRAWLDSVPTSKKVWVGGLFMHKNGPNEFYIDGISSGTVSADVAAQAAVQFGGFFDAPSSGQLPQT